MTPKRPQLQFLGAAETVTGSKYLLETEHHRLLVDCGLFQGLKQLRLLNWAQLNCQPTQLDWVLLTHGHMDHCGYLPRLYRQGFRGKILGTEPTLAVAEIVLRDSARIQEEEAERANERGYSRHNPAEPLYTTEDVETVLPHFEAVAEGQWLGLADDLRVRFQYVGHIIGATFIEMQTAERNLVFSGDIGRQDDPLMYPPKKPTQADLLLIESTYGNRLHPTDDPFAYLEKIIHQTVRNKGSLIIPCFAVERTQSLMYILWQLKQQQRIPPIPIFMDSPMARAVLDLFEQTLPWHRLSREACREMGRQIHVVQGMNETLAIAGDRKPKVVITGSGMLTGGRVLTYLQRLLEKKQTALLLSGFQAAGTRGRQLLDGATELKIYGHYYQVKAKVLQIESLSAHADQKGLLDWLNELKTAPQHLFIVHGEPQAADMLRVKIRDTYGWDSQVAAMNQVVTL